MINSDLQLPAFAHADDTNWTLSPSGGVERKRFYRDGGAESGQVSSLVRYLPGARFPQHEHPSGEEIFVLEGTFSDHTVDCRAPGYLLNPEGFTHAPWSENGCLIFVRLQQYTGSSHVVVTANDIHEDAERTVLHEEGNRLTSLVSLGEGQFLQGSYPGGLEGVVIDGQLRVNSHHLKSLDWFRFPPGARVNIASLGCRIYLQENAVKVL